MDADLVSTYRTMALVQQKISVAQTLDEALREGIRIIARELQCEEAIIWYAEGEEQVLRPYFWLAPTDLTAHRHALGDGIVGRVFASQQAERMLRYEVGSDPSAERDLEDGAIRSMIAVPFSSMSEELGVVEFINKKDGTCFSEEEADIIEMLVMIAAISVTQNEAVSAPSRLGDAMLTVRGVTREYVNGDIVTKVLRGVNIDVYEGELLVLLGESGCGKSTLMNIIAGMDAPTSGVVEFKGQPIVGASEKELTRFRRNNVGFVFQSYNLMPNLNARQNLDLIGELVDEPLPTDEALELVGLSERKENYPSQMSGGQQQRVSIARALVKRPRLVFADEPTAALDYETSIEVLSVLEKVVETGTTLVMVTHNEEICRMADRVVRMRDGRTHEVTINRVRVTAKDLVW